MKAPRQLNLKESLKRGIEMLRFFRPNDLPLPHVPGSPFPRVAEMCFYVETTKELTPTEVERLAWLLGTTSRQSLIPSGNALEFGPRLNFATAYSTTAVAICHACGLPQVTRVEHSTRLGFDALPNEEEQVRLLEHLLDRMTEMPYLSPLMTFDHGFQPERVKVIDISGDDWWQVLKRFKPGWDDQDIELLGSLFRDVLHRNPTDVELAQWGEANSEHCRHWFFRGNPVINGRSTGESLMDVVKTPWEINPGNSVIAFSEDASAIEGAEVTALLLPDPRQPGAFILRKEVRHPTCTAETHNYPSGVEPYQGAMTGTGGRIRDGLAPSRGGHVVAGTAGYCVAALGLPGYDLPWEKNRWHHPSNLASPLAILLGASDGASDYGNCFGEPIINGFVRSTEIDTPTEHRSWLKPIVFIAGVGSIQGEHTKAGEPEKGMLVVRIGGPDYRIGIGGGSGSSLMQGQQEAELDFAAVQRGAPAMEQPVHRVIRACIETEDGNPIVKIVDLGAGGNCNAVTELVEPTGARIELRDIPLGDPSLSTLEIWINESQERMVMIIRADRLEDLRRISEREGAPCAVLGVITGDGTIVLHDASDDSTPVNLPLSQILGKLPPKRFELQRVRPQLKPISLPSNLTVREALDRVLRLISVGGKCFLTRKADRGVTGLVVQQQCVGPAHLPVADFGLVAAGYFDTWGTAIATGEQPMKGLISPETMARLAVAEMLLNMSGVRITRIEDIKLEANWMLAAKLAGEGAWLWDAACALRDICVELGMAIDGGKDSLSMAATVADPDGINRVVMAPGQLVLTGYARVPDIRQKVTPDAKTPGNSLLHIDLSPNNKSLGGSALAQVFGTIGDECPDVNDVQLLKRAFNTLQELVRQGLIHSLHDVSDGGLVTTLLEMAFAGNTGLDITLCGTASPLEALFSEGPGVVVECSPSHALQRAMMTLMCSSVPVTEIGWVTPADSGITIEYNGETVVKAPMPELRAIWEETGFAIDLSHESRANPKSINEEQAVCRNLITPPPYELTFTPKPTAPAALNAGDKPKVAIIREISSNGDREMAAAFMSAGFEPWDVTMRDLSDERISLDKFRGIAFVGGFSFGDVLGAARGWAGVIRFNERLRLEFERFRAREDTFALGVCNGYQLMTLLGWVPGTNLPESEQPLLLKNTSGRFESCFPTLRIEESPAIMLRGMAGSRLGIWAAHGEGRLHTPNPSVIQSMLDSGQAPLRYANASGEATEEYPFNPNGSMAGIAGMCDPTGRFLGTMMHPERTFLTWQWPWIPPDWKGLKASPWLRMFQNAYEWCRS